MYMRSVGATRPPVVLYQRRLFQPNVLSTAMKKPFTIRFAMVESESCSRSASVTFGDLPFSLGCCHHGLGASSVGVGAPPSTMPTAAAAAAAPALSPAASPSFVVGVSLSAA